MPCKDIKSIHCHISKTKFLGYEKVTLYDLRILAETSDLIVLGSHYVRLRFMPVIKNRKKAARCRPETITLSRTKTGGCDKWVAVEDPALEEIKSCKVYVAPSWTPNQYLSVNLDCGAMDHRSFEEG